MMTAQSPLVTIGFLTYNSAETVRDALDSLLAQDYPNIELLIRDDVSSDDSYEICKSYAEKHDVIELTRNRENLGQYGNLNRLLQDVRGDYFLWACPDDAWDASYVSKCVAALEADRDMVAVLVGTRRVTPEATWIDRYDPDLDPSRRSAADLAFVMARMKFMSQPYRRRHGPIGRVIMGLMRTDVARELYDYDMPYLAYETFMVIKLILMGRIGYIDEPLYEKRNLHGGFMRRYPEDETSVTRSDRLIVYNAARAFARQLSKSKIIPLRRKLLGVLAILEVMRWVIMAKLWGYIRPIRNRMRSVLGTAGARRP